MIKLIRTNAFEEAQDRFRRLQIDYPESVLPEAMQLEIANRIQADGDRDTAAVAYERFLKRYPSSRQAPEVRLLLAVLLIRFLNRSQEAIPLLEKATPDLISESHRRLAEKLLDEAGTAKEPSP